MRRRSVRLRHGIPPQPRLLVWDAEQRRRPSAGARTGVLVPALSSERPANRAPPRRAPAAQLSVRDIAIDGPSRFRSRPPRRPAPRRARSISWRTSSPPCLRAPNQLRSPAAHPFCPRSITGPTPRALVRPPQRASQRAARTCPLAWKGVVTYAASSSMSYRQHPSEGSESFRVLALRSGLSISGQSVRPSVGCRASEFHRLVVDNHGQLIAVDGYVGDDRRAHELCV